MAELITVGRIKLKFDTEENWLKSKCNQSTSSSRILSGEPVFSKKSDGTVVMKVGDGKSLYSQLPTLGSGDSSGITHKIEGNNLIISLTNSIGTVVDSTTISLNRVNSLSFKDYNSEKKTLYLSNDTILAIKP